MVEHKTQGPAIQDRELAKLALVSRSQSRPNARNSQKVSQLPFKAPLHIENFSAEAKSGKYKYAIQSTKVTKPKNIMNQDSANLVIEKY